MNYVAKGHENLIPMSERSKEEVRELARRGGINSGKTRKAKKTLSDKMNMLLDLPISNNKDFNKLVKLGIKMEDLDNAELIAVALFNQAKKGDVTAIQEIRKMVGDINKQSDEEEDSVADTLKELIGGGK